MKAVNLNNETIKILGTHFSYNKVLQQEKNFYHHITQIQNVLKLWRMRDLSLEGKIVVFKTLAISKIIHLALITTISTPIINQLEKIQKDFIWNGKKAKIKQKTLCNSYENGGLKNVDIKTKVSSLQCSWINRLYDKNSHDWKIIPLSLINKYLGINFKFHNSIDIDKALLTKFPIYYQEIFHKWKQNYTFLSKTPSSMLSEFLWFNSCIKIDKKSVHFQAFSQKGLNFVGQLFINGKLKTWEDIQSEFNLTKNQKFRWFQIIHALPKNWKNIINDDNGNSNNLVLYDSHICRGGLIYSLNKLTSKELYQLQINYNPTKPTAQEYFEKLFNQINLDWKQIYLLCRKTTVDTSLRVFQYKILNNILFLNKKLFMFGIVTDSKCSFCKKNDETVQHIYINCTIVSNLWKQLKRFFSPVLELPDLLPQSAFFGFLDIDNDCSSLINHILLIFKLYVYKARKKEKVDLNSLINYICKIKDTEEKICQDDFRKKQKFFKKWKKITRLLNL